ncbi:MAG: hypothetical protein V1930_03510 [Pseudomonadota bacterium]
MKKTSLLIILFLVLSPAILGAEDFLGAPVIPDSKTNLRTGNRLEAISPLTHDDVLDFYRKTFKGDKDIRFRNWKEQTYIEDDGSLAWHSITISKEYQGGTAIVIVKDNWTWIIGTLILRFIGVFVVLLILFLGMSLSGSIISRWMKNMEAKGGNKAST